MKRFLKRLSYAFVGFFVLLFVIAWLVRPKEPTEAERAANQAQRLLDSINRARSDAQQDSIRKARYDAEYSATLQSRQEIKDGKTVEVKEEPKELPQWYKCPDDCEETGKKTQDGYPIYRERKTNRLLYLGVKSLSYRKIYLPN